MELWRHPLRPAGGEYFSRTVNTIGQITEHAESQKHDVFMYLYLLTKLSQSCPVVYHVQPIMMVYTP